MDLHDMPLHVICFELDMVCPPYWFTFSGNNENGAIYVGPSSMKSGEIAKFEVNEDNPIEYVFTKILLQFGGGTTNA